MVSKTIKLHSVLTATCVSVDSFACTASALPLRQALAQAELLELCAWGLIPLYCSRLVLALEQATCVRVGRVMTTTMPTSVRCSSSQRSRSC